MPTLTQHQKRYDKCVATRLPLEFKWFLKNQTGKHPISKELKSDDGLPAFIEHAHSCGYLLGMKPYLLSDDLSVQIKNIGWRFEATAKKPFPNHRAGGRDPAQTVDTSTMISGFGITLNLLGWKLFIGTTFDLLMSRLNSGKSIEEIYDLFRVTSFFSGEPKLFYLGEQSYSLNEVLEKTGISLASYKKALHDRSVKTGRKGSQLSMRERQLVLDELIAKTKNSDCQGLIQRCGNWFVQVSKDDLAIVQQNSALENIAPKEWLHRILQNYSYQ